MGEIKTKIVIEEKPLDYRLNINGWDYAIEQMPEPKCKHTNCCGRGYAGVNIITGQPIPCKCVGRWELLHEPDGGGAEDGPPNG